MNRIKRAALIALLISASSATAGGRYDFAIRHAGDMLADYCRVADLPGASVAVAIDGRIVWSQGFGWADIERRVPVTPLTRFRTASIAKPMSATAVARLAQRKRLDVDAPIEKYLPDLPDLLKPITMRQLAGHLAGVRHYIPTDPSDRLYGLHFDDARSALRRFVDSPLIAEPGAGFNYSTYGYTLLAAAAEGATNQPFGELLKAELLEPLGLHHTQVENVLEPSPDRAFYYERGGDGRLKNAPTADLSYKVPGGGLISTPEDLVLFASALFEPGFVDADTLSLLMTPMKNADGKSTNYGFGWSIRKTPIGRGFGHTGGQIGTTTALAAWPEKRIAVAVMCNLSGSPLGMDEVGEIAALFLACGENNPQGEIEASIEGVYEFEFEMPEGPFRGWLAAAVEGGDLFGQTVVHGAMNSDSLRLMAQVVGGYRRGDELTIYLVQPQRGLGVLQLHATETGFEGTLNHAGGRRDKAVLRRIHSGEH